MRLPASVLAAATAAVVAAAAFAGDVLESWHRSPDDGRDAAKKSGRPVLVVTLWKDGVCNACDTWRTRVPGDADVRRQLDRFERVAWNYDGLQGKVIPWTLENGGKSTDPSVQAFVTGADGKVVARCDDAAAYAPSAFAAWLREQADRWEREHPRTALPFVPASVTVAGEGADAKAVCAALEGAREGKRPALLYFAREAPPADDRSKEAKARRAEASASRDLEKAVLDSKQAADAAKGWTLLRFDLGDANHALYAKSLGVETAPALLLMVPGEEKPAKMPRPTAADLAFRLRKHAPKDVPDDDAPKPGDGK